MRGHSPQLGGWVLLVLTIVKTLKFTILARLNFALIKMALSRLSREKYEWRYILIIVGGFPHGIVTWEAITNIRCKYLL